MVDIFIIYGDYIQLVGLREKLQETLIFHGKIYEHRWFPEDVPFFVNPLMHVLNGWFHVPQPAQFHFGDYAVVIFLSDRV